MVYRHMLCLPHLTCVLEELSFQRRSRDWIVNMKLWVVAMNGNPIRRYGLFVPSMGTASNNNTTICFLCIPPSQPRAHSSSYVAHFARCCLHAPEASAASLRATPRSRSSNRIAKVRSEHEVQWLCVKKRGTPNMLQIGGGCFLFGFL